MADQLHDARQLLGVLHKRRAIVITSLMLSLTTATAYNYSSRPLYQATAQILIDRSMPDVLPGKDLLVDNKGVDWLNTQYHLLRSRALAEKVVERLNLQRSQEFQSGPLMTPWERLQRVLGRRVPANGAGEMRLSPAAAAFRSRLSVEAVPQSTLVNLRFTAYDPVLSALAVNTLAQTYIETSMELRFHTGSEATGWLSDKAKEQQKKIEDAERALQAYREREGLMSLEERQALINQKMATLTTSVMAARTERITKETLYNQMRSLPAGQLQTFPLMLASVTIQGYRKHLADLRQEEAKLSDVIGDRHPDMVRVRADVTTAEQKIAAELEAIMRSVETEYQTAQQQEASFQANLEGVKREALDVSREAVEYGILKRDLETSQQLFAQLMQRSKEAGLETDLKPASVRIVEKAEIPGGPFSPNRPANYRLALLLGLGLGIALALLVEQFDNTVKTPDELKDLGLPFLGMVPDAGGGKRTGSNLAQAVSPLILKNPRSALAEAYRVVRTNILFSSADGAGRVIAVSSVNPGEGKSTTVVNVAASLAQNGSRVLAIDADLRRPTLHQHFSVASTPGLSDAIVGKCKPAEAIRTTPFKGLEVLPCGYVPPNPAELLGSAAMHSLLAQLRERYDVVLVDTPPILAIADTTVLSRHVDGFILVLAAERTSRPAIHRAVDQLTRVGGKVIGTVLNRVDLARNSYYYNQYYGEYYRNYYHDPGTQDAAGGGKERTARQA